MGISRNWTTAHFLSFWWPWNCHGARVYVIDHADVLQQAYTEAQGRLEVNLSTTLNLVGFQSVYVMFLGSVILLKVVPCPFLSGFSIRGQPAEERKVWKGDQVKSTGEAGSSSSK